MKALMAAFAICSLPLAVACGGHSSSHSTLTETGVEAVLPSECSPAIGVDSPLLLDDFEDGDLELSRASNLHGAWYVNNDETGQQAPMPGAETRGLIASEGSPASPAYALHTSGSGFEHWGAFAAAHLNESRGHACTFDLSSYAGLHLSFKGEGGLRVNLGTRSTTPIVDGGSCSGDACSDYGKSFELGPDWRSVDIAFAELEQPAWASPAGLNLAESLRISLWAERADFDFWVDDLRFYQ
jgi:hypothetical protein